MKWTGKNDMGRSTSEYGFTGTYRGLEVTSTVPYPTYQALRAANQTLTDLAAFSTVESLQRRRQRLGGDRNRLPGVRQLL